MHSDTIGTMSVADYQRDTDRLTTERDEALRLLRAAESHALAIAGERDSLVLQLATASAAVAEAAEIRAENATLADMLDGLHRENEQLAAAVKSLAVVADTAMAEAGRLKACVRTHHDQRGDERCFLDDLNLYHDALGIGADPYITAMPPDAEESCNRYRSQRQHPDVAGTYPMPAGCMTIAQLEDEVGRLHAALSAYIYENSRADTDADFDQAYRFRAFCSDGMTRFFARRGEAEAAIGLGPKPEETDHG